MSTFGTAIKISLFGESHGESIGITIHHLPPNQPIDLLSIQTALNRRKPSTDYHTKRKEQDTFIIISGLKDNKTTGAPLTALIKNEDINSNDYPDGPIRPGHADYPSRIKYKNANDKRGSGHFSGRLTAPLIILGAIATQLLRKKNITIASHIKSIHTLHSASFYDLTPTKETLENLINSGFPVLNPENKSRYITTIKSAQKAQDSLGGTIETMILSPTVGLGEPFFDSFESTLSHLIFSIPSVKGLSFGKGFALTTLKGSQTNDPLTLLNTQPTFTKNDMGGILGGLSTGQPIIFTTAIKPPSSIKQSQRSIDMTTHQNITLNLTGRHDPCIVPRVIHVINALTAYTVLELTIRNEGLTWTT